MSWTDQPIFFVDFEGSRAAGILEYGVATVVGGQVTEVRTRLCRAKGRISPEDTAVHGLTESVVEGSPPFSDDWDYFADLRERGPLAAHYAGVENSLLKSVWPYPRASTNFARPGERIIDWGPWVDTAALYHQLYPKLGTGKLESLVVATGRQHELDTLAAANCPQTRRRYHAALYDALAGAVLLCALARDPQLAALSTTQLLALSALDGEKRDTLRQGELF